MAKIVKIGGQYDINQNKKRLFPTKILAQKN